MAASANAFTNESHGYWCSYARVAAKIAAMRTSRPVAAIFIPAAPGWAGLNRAKAVRGRDVAASIRSSIDERARGFTLRVAARVPTGCDGRPAQRTYGT